MKKRKPNVKKSPEVMTRICAEISAGKSLKAACKRADLPDNLTVLRWISADESFSAMYDQARINRGNYFGERVADLAQQAIDGKLDPNVARVAGDLLKWSAARMAPKVYGDRIEQNIAVTDTSEQHLKAVKELAESGAGAKVVPLRAVKES